MQTLSLRPRRTAPFGVILVVVAMLFFGLLGGVATALAGPLATALFGGIVFAAMALVLPLRWLVVAVVLLSFVVTGQLIYFARLEKALWFPFLAGALLMVRFPLDYMHRSSRPLYGAASMPRTPTGLKTCIVVYFLVLFGSTLINRSPLLQVVVSSKEYLYLWGLYLVLVNGLVTRELVVRIWNGLPWLMVFQLPLVLYQRFVVMPGRRNVGIDHDAIVGAFGGNPMGGGSSGAMGLFCVIGVVTVIARWRQRLLPTWQCLLLVTCGLLGIGLAEVKFMVLLLPLAFGLIFARDLARHPVRSVLFIVLGFALALGVLAAYKLQFAQQDKHQTTKEYFDSMFSASTDPDFVDMRTGEMGRVAAIRFWYRKHGVDNPTHLLIGHGAGASRVGSTVVGVAAKRYPFNISRSALATLLWEIGVLGTGAFVALLAAAYLVLFRQSGDERLGIESRTALSSMAVAVVMLAASLPYNTDLLYSHQMQILLMLCLGYAAMMNAQDPAPRQGSEPLRPNPKRRRP